MEGSFTDDETTYDNRDPVTDFFFFFGMMTRAWWIKLVVGEQIELSRSR